jgi:hypothetical protein
MKNCEIRDEGGYADTLDIAFGRRGVRRASHDYCTCNNRAHERRFVT